MVEANFRERLFERFPSMYKHPGLFDFSPPPGWYDLIWTLSEKLEPLGVKVVQVKSKFGGLRFYIAGGNDESHRLIDEAERVSEETCEVCGKVGKTSGRGWLRTRCAEHEAADK